MSGKAINNPNLNRKGSSIVTFDMISAKNPNVIHEEDDASSPELASIEVGLHDPR